MVWWWQSALDKGRGERRKTQQNKIDPWHCQEHSTALQPCSQFFDLSHHLLRPPPSPIPTHQLCRSFVAVVVTTVLSSPHCRPPSFWFCMTTMCDHNISLHEHQSFQIPSFHFCPYLLSLFPPPTCPSSFSFQFSTSSLTHTYVWVLSLDLLHWDDVRNIKSQHIKWIIVWEVDPLHRSLSPATISIIGFSYMSIKNCIHPMKCCQHIKFFLMYSTFIL